jgi:hypothetical protein
MSRKIIDSEKDLQTGFKYEKVQKNTKDYSKAILLFLYSFLKFVLNYFILKNLNC